MTDGMVIQVTLARAERAPFAVVNTTAFGLRFWQAPRARDAAEDGAGGQVQGGPQWQVAPGSSVAYVWDIHVGAPQRVVAELVFPAGNHTTQLLGSFSFNEIADFGSVAAADTEAVPVSVRVVDGIRTLWVGPVVHDGATMKVISFWHGVCACVGVFSSPPPLCASKPQMLFATCSPNPTGVSSTMPLVTIGLRPRRRSASPLASRSGDCWSLW